MRNDRLVLYADKTGWHVGVAKENSKVFPFWYIPSREEPGELWLLDEIRRGEWQNKEFKYLTQRWADEAERSRQRARENNSEALKKEITKPERLYLT